MKSKKPCSTIQSIVYKSLIRAENVLIELAKTAQGNEAKERSETTTTVEQSLKTLDNVSTQLGSTSVSSISMLEKEEPDGVVVELNLKICNPGDEKIVEMEIECPNYKPKRIFFDGKWRKLQPVK